MREFMQYERIACTNCQQKHAKCSGGATCERCILRNLECTFIDSGKKRGPKTNGKNPGQVYVLNSYENDFDRTFVLSSIILNAMQEHKLILTSPSGHLQQQSDIIDEFTHFNEEQNIHAFQEVSPFSYQARTDAGYIMQNNNLVDNMYNNNEIFFLYNNLFFDNNYMLSFRN
ncbi:43769_t:CDS:2 [Gigaspora margarita]|uniref:43769_t:CDS:1 n=1 Tax=Gigaspora margarita TaxID=4874 RepID=A0ABN7V283_GIGMA|nr:43769_t:CDS:2 [Gigaspora margarita]